MYWITRLDRLPPNVCRLLARQPHVPKRPLTTEQIAQRSGLSVQTIRRISRLKSWATVSVEMLEKFEVGCGITPGRECLQVAYLKRTYDPEKTQTPLFHLRRLIRSKKDIRRDRYIENLLTMKVEP